MCHNVAKTRASQGWCNELSHTCSSVMSEEPLLIYSPAAKGYDCAFCDKSTKIGTLVVLYRPI